MSFDTTPKITHVRSLGNLSLYQEERDYHVFLTSIGDLEEWGSILYRAVDVSQSKNIYYYDPYQQVTREYITVAGPVSDPVFCWRQALKYAREQKKQLQIQKETLENLPRACMKCQHGFNAWSYINNFRGQEAIECRRFPETVIKNHLDYCSEYKAKTHEP
jgi:hypothetical protein